MEAAEAKREKTLMKTQRDGEKRNQGYSTRRWMTLFSDPRELNGGEGRGCGRRARTKRTRRINSM